MAKKPLFEELDEVNGGASNDESVGEHKYSVNTVITGDYLGEFELTILELLTNMRYKVHYVHHKHARRGTDKIFTEDEIRSLIACGRHIKIVQGE